MSELPASFPLPPIPESQRDDAVAAWSEPVAVRTYEPGEPGRLMQKTFGRCRRPGLMDRGRSG